MVASRPAERNTRQVAVLRCCQCANNTPDASRYTETSQRISERRLKSSPRHTNDTISYTGPQGSSTSVFVNPAAYNLGSRLSRTKKRSPEQNTSYIIIKTLLTIILPSTPRSHRCSFSNTRTTQHVSTLQSKPLHIHLSHAQRANPRQPSLIPRPLDLHAQMSH